MCVIMNDGSQAKNPIVHGGGSGQVFPDYVSTPFDGIRALFGIAPAPTPSPPSNNCSAANWVKGVDFFNQDKQSSTGAKDVAACCEDCGADPDCNAFTFVGGECWMKADTKNPKPNSGAMSGICAKGPAPPTPPGQLKSTIPPAFFFFKLFLFFPFQVRKYWS